MNEKNPSEITALQQDVDMLLEVQNLDNTNRDTLLKIQEKV